MKHIIFLSFFALIFASCVHDDYECDPGAMNIETEWSQVGEGITLPGRLDAELSGEPLPEGRIYPIATEGGVIYGLDPGDYKMDVYNEAEHITVAGSAASVDAVSTRLSELQINALPGWFFTSHIDVPIRENATTYVKAPMTQQIRELILVFNIIHNAGPVTLDTYTATLDGVAGRLDLATGELDRPAYVAFPFTRQADRITARVRLLGIIPQMRQLLILHLGYSDGSSQEIPVDLSEKLEGFNTGKHIPKELEAGLTLSIRAGITATIDGWIDNTQNIFIPKK